MRKTIILAVLSMLSLTMSAQLNSEVQNRPYTDLRTLHFGILVGTHVQDLELINAGMQTITADDGSQSQTLVAADQDRWDAGFTVGVLGELRLSTHFQLRVAPAMLFGTRHLTFHNLTALDGDGKPTETRQELKTAYFATNVDLIFAAPRAGNHRPYIVGGVCPMLNLSGKDDDYVKLKGFDAFAEIGVGCDFYLPFFKIRPELKFMYSLTNSLDGGHAANVRDSNMLPYVKSVSEARSKVIALTFYFE